MAFEAAKHAAYHRHLLACSASGASDSTYEINARELFDRQVFHQPFGHDRNLLLLALFDLRDGKVDLAAFGVAEGDFVGPFAGDEAGHGCAVVEHEEISDKALGDRFVGQQHRLGQLPTLVGFGHLRQERPTQGLARLDRVTFAAVQPDEQLLAPRGLARMTA